MKILLTSTFVTPFITEDLNILRKHWEVEHLTVRGPGALLAIALAVSRADLVYTWFASTYAAAAVASARALRRPAVIALGGADVAGIPDIGYGIWISPWKSRCVSYALRNADRIIAVDPFLKAEAVRWARYDGRNIEVLPTGYDSGFWTPEGEKAGTVLTVASCDSDVRLRVKGVDILLEAARLLPGTRFTLAGIDEPFAARLRANAPPNIDIRGKLPREEIRSLYRRAKVYCQPSRFEGLPNAVCEALLCGCIPVCSDVGGMRTAAGGSGLIVPGGDPRALASALRQVLEAPPADFPSGRESIAARFSLERREEGLVKLIGGLIG